MLSENEFIKWFKDKQGNLVALWVSGGFEPQQTLFLTPDTCLQQLGFIFRTTGGKIDPHFHKAVMRELKGTSEFLLLKKGRVFVNLYSEKKELVSSFTMETNDMLLLISGGHGFTFLEEGFFIEVKQGPYLGVKEKEHFSGQKD